MDPESKNATQPFVYHTNKVVTKARERDFPSLFEASFFALCLLDSIVELIAAFMSCRHIFYTRVHKVKKEFNSFCRHLLVLLFHFLPISQCDTSFRSSPSASASVDHKLLHIVRDSKTKTNSKTTTTTKTTTTNTKAPTPKDDNCNNDNVR